MKASSVGSYFDQKKSIIIENKTDLLDVPTLKKIKTFIKENDDSFSNEN